MMSMYSRSRTSAPTAARSAMPTSWTAASGNRALFNPARTQAAMARFDSSASEPPRRMQALPALMQSAAASAVTFGRDS